MEQNRGFYRLQLNFTCRRMFHGSQTLSFGGALLTSQSRKLIIGADETEMLHFDRAVDEFVMHMKALSASEILTRYNSHRLGGRLMRYQVTQLYFLLFCTMIVVAFAINTRPASTQSQTQSVYFPSIQTASNYPSPDGLISLSSFEYFGEPASTDPALLNGQLGCISRIGTLGDLRFCGFDWFGRYGRAICNNEHFSAEVSSTPLNFGANFSLTLWIKSNQAGSIISASGTQSVDLQIGEDGKLHAILTAEADTDAQIKHVVGNTVINDHRWHMVTITYEQASSDVTLFVDGVPESTTMLTDSDYSYSLDNVEVLLANGPISNTPLNPSCFDELSMYARLLSSQEVKQLFDAIPPNEIAHVGQWLALEESAGSTTFADKSRYARSMHCEADSCPEAVSGVSGLARRFDGVDDVIHTDNLPNFQTNAFVNYDATLEVWGRSTSNAKTTLMEVSGFQEVRFGTLSIGLLADGRVFASGAYTHTFSSVSNTLTSARQLNDGEWHHIVFTHRNLNPFNANYTGGIGRLYVDGILVTQGQWRHLFSSNQYHDWHIGSDRLALTHWQGDIDEPVYHLQALTPEQVLARYNSYR